MADVAIQMKEEGQKKVFFLKLQFVEVLECIYL